jgi:hypothetical protein
MRANKINEVLKYFYCRSTRYTLDDLVNPKFMINCPLRVEEASPKSMSLPVAACEKINYKLPDVLPRYLAFSSLDLKQRRPNRDVRFTLRKKPSATDFRGELIENISLGALSRKW